MDVLVTIKRLMLAGCYQITEKARLEMDHDGLTELDVVEAIVSAPAIYKTLRSTSLTRRRGREYLYVIQGITLDGTLLYTKGTIRREQGQDVYYLLISSKRSD